MLRWLGALIVLSLVAFLLASGLVPFKAVGVARILLAGYATVLACSLVVAILRWR